MIAWVGLGELAWDDIPARIKTRTPLDPNPGNRAVYDERYAEFHALYQKTRGLFSRMNRRVASP
jgi:xylulokinase